MQPTCAAIFNGGWTDWAEDVLVLRDLREVEHTVRIPSGEGVRCPNMRVPRRRLGGTAVQREWVYRAVFAHEFLLGVTGEPFESIEYAWREHCETLRGEDD